MQQGCFNVALRSLLKWHHCKKLLFQPLKYLDWIPHPFCPFLRGRHARMTVFPCIRLQWIECYSEKFQAQSQKTNLRTCAPSEDSDQPAHSRRLIRIFAERILDSRWCKNILYAGNKYSDQSVRMRWPILVFTGRTRQKVRFLTLGHISWTADKQLETRYM